MQTNHQLKIVVLLATVLLLCGANFPVAAETPQSYGPQSKYFGGGLYLGEPTGLTVKGYLAQRLALDGVFAWSLNDEAFNLIGDISYEFLDIRTDSQNFSIPFYAGVGLKLGFDEDGENDGETEVGIRVPVGIAFQFTKHPIELFLEISPGIQVAPDSEIDVTGGIGGRFYFF